MKNIPLAEQMRPKTLEQYYGQRHLMGEGSVLWNALRQKQIPSMILWGPPGVGKTTLALLIANHLNCNFYQLSAINAGVKDIRDVIESARHSMESSILFIDEIHRFNKSQQESLLGALEAGILTLIGATTENPSFEVISPLLSRCQVYVLTTLARAELEAILQNATELMQQLLQKPIVIEECEALLKISGGDARKLLNAFELSCSMLSAAASDRIVITNKAVETVIQQNLAMYDKSGENHYDIISAFIKSLRGSDPNAAVYWLARMLSGGEDPLFIARRMLILAAEDVGNANPNALLLAQSCFQSVHAIGMPEGRIILSQTAVYLACSPKSNASYMAIEKAIEMVENTKNLPVPLHLRNAPTKLMKELNYGKDYRYAHDFEDNFVHQEFLPQQISSVRFYNPGNNPRENELRHRLKALWKDKYGY
jgi:putative ATPase